MRPVDGRTNRSRPRDFAGHIRSRQRHNRRHGRPTPPHAARALPPRLDARGRRRARDHDVERVAGDRRAGPRRREPAARARRQAGPTDSGRTAAGRPRRHDPRRRRVRPPRPRSDRRAGGRGTGRRIRLRDPEVAAAGRSTTCARPVPASRCASTSTSRSSRSTCWPATTSTSPSPTTTTSRLRSGASTTSSRRCGTWSGGIGVPTRDRHLALADLADRDWIVNSRHTADEDVAAHPGLARRLRAARRAPHRLARARRRPRAGRPRGRPPAARTYVAARGERRTPAGPGGQAARLCGDPPRSGPVAAAASPHGAAGHRLSTLSPGAPSTSVGPSRARRRACRGSGSAASAGPPPPGPSPRTPSR